MCKKFLLFLFMLVFFTGGTVQAVDISWNNTSGDQNWFNPANWSLGVFPTTNHTAYINMIPGPVITVAGATAKQVIVGSDDSTGALTVDGGILYTTEDISLAEGTTGAANATLTIENGTVTVQGSLFAGNAAGGGTSTINLNGGTLDIVDGKYYIGYLANNDATINMTGGTINGKAIWLGNAANGSGNLNLTGGTIDCGGILMRQNGADADWSYTGGIAKFRNNHKVKIQDYIRDEWITTDASNQLVVDFNVTNPSYTTVVLTDITGTYNYWNNTSGDQNWHTDSNWSLGEVPTTAHTAYINMTPGPVITAAGATAKRVIVGSGDSTGAVTVVSGTLYTTEYISLAEGTSGAANATLTIDNGTVTVQDALFAGNAAGGGTVTINLNGGTLDVVDVKYYIGNLATNDVTFNMTGGTLTGRGLWIGMTAGGDVDFNMTGGTIDSGGITMRQGGSTANWAFLDGTVIFNGNIEDKMQGYIDDGWITTGLDEMVFVSYSRILLKTILEVGPYAFTPTPADGSSAAYTTSQLQWSLPSPLEGGATVTCDVFFGTGATPTTQVVNKQSVTSVSISPSADTDYNWYIKVYDSSISTTVPYITSDVFSFYVQDVGDDYFDTSGFNRPLTLTPQHPSAHYFNGKTYIVYQGMNSMDPVICSYNHSTKQWKGPVKVGTNPLSDNDNHGRPVLVVSDDGHIHVMFGGHGGTSALAGSNSYGGYSSGENIHVRSNLSEDIGSSSDWTRVNPAPGGDNTGDISVYGTYSQPVKVANGDIYFFNRHGSHVSDWTYQMSTNNGVTWDSEVRILAHTSVETWYAYFAKRRHSDTIIDCQYNYHPGGSGGDKQNLYYMSFDTADGQWRNAAGVNLNSMMPLNKADSDAYTLVFDSNPDDLDESDPNYTQVSVGIVRTSPAGNPHMVAQFGNKSQCWSWTGSSWTDQWFFTGGWNGGENEMDFICLSDTRFKAVVSGRYGAEVAIWDIDTVAGTQIKTDILGYNAEYEYFNGSIPTDYHDDAWVLFYENTDPVGSDQQTRKMFLWGDHGFIVRPVLDYGFAAWSYSHVLAEGALGDDDKDGLSNLYEYGMGGDPTNGFVDGNLPVFGFVGSGLVYSYAQRTDDSNLVYYIETKEDLVDGPGWTNAGYAVVSTNVTGSVFDVVTNSIPTTATQQFIRLIIE
ncbi:BNR-4 repeat-containing protein [Pontiella sulfatireligans]|uniref:Uncharacterized protein n=1 Tax=Pontiella sulfatireligans TaxID=2750658 RepID=A0A6C2USC8_9BACT|nr:BNR-4 repeat-containing protein [Pontiella sulfatireligans]VGO23240.1 hypothetical protein SCARR_05347 [Pontiella sulfatireligans]